MFEAAAFCPSRMTRSMPGPRVMMSRKPSTPAAGRRERRTASSIASTFSALAIAERSRSGDAGLTTKSKAPARIAETTVSMPPCAVCTITGSAIARSAHRFEDAEPVDARHGKVEDDRRDVAAARPVEQVQRRLAAVGEDRLVAEFGDGALEQAALDGIVVDDENRGGHAALKISPMQDDCRMDHPGTGF